MAEPPLETWFLGRVGVCEAEKFTDLLVSFKKRSLVPNMLLITEHFPVFRCQRWARDKHAIHNLPLFRAYCENYRIPVVQTPHCGGSMMYHGPGQLVLYPVVTATDIIAYRRTLEETMIRLCEHISGVAAFRIFFNEEKGCWESETGISLSLFGNQEKNGTQGVWVFDHSILKKIGFLGFHCTPLGNEFIMHRGCALNLSPDLKPFSLINVCGLPGALVSSLEHMGGSTPLIDTALAKKAAELFAEINGFSLCRFEDRSEIHTLTHDMMV